VNAVLKPLITLLLVLFVDPAALLAGSVGARFSADKAAYLLGEPVFVTLTVTNNGIKTVWLEFKSPDMALLCHDFATEVSGAELPEEWGCGIAGSCGRGLPGVEPGKSITVRRLLNHEFRFRRIGPYSIHAHTTVMVREKDLWDSPIIDQVEAGETIPIKVQRGSETQLRAAFQPFVAEIDNPDPMTQNDAVSAITELAPPFLEDVLIRLTKTKYASAAMIALRKANTPEAWDVLAQLATDADDSSVRTAAIQNLGRTSGRSYLPVLFQSMQSSDKEIRRAAASAAGQLGRGDSVQQLAALLSSADADIRQAGIEGLGNTHARAAVPLLIGMLLDSEASVRSAVVGSLRLLTHRVALDDKVWSDVTTPEGAAAVRKRWVRWWNADSGDAEMHGLSDCASPESID
jgi:hypothetical protein